jgi:hypothetical protein
MPMESGQRRSNRISVPTGTETKSGDRLAHTNLNQPNKGSNLDMLD